MKLIKKLGMATSEKRETMSSLGFDRVMTRDRMIQSLKGRALSRAFSSRSAGEDFMFKCMFKSLAKAQKDRKRWLSSEILKYMGLLPADCSFHYVINFVNEDDDCIGLGSGESSGSSSLPTTWWEVWEQFSQTKCPKAPPLVDSACPNPMQQSLLNCIKFLQRPKIYCDIFAEGFGNRVRIIMKFTEGVGCQFWWAMRPLKDDTRETTFHVISNYKLFCQRGCLVDADFTFSQFDHSEILSSLNKILINNPLLTKTLDIEESLVTDQPWPDSMLDIAKFAICFANILMTGAAKPQGLFHFPEGES
jgi:hypothetical protein